MKAINLSTDLVQQKSLLTDAEEMMGESSPVTKTQNMSLMSDIGNTLSTKKETEFSAMDSMKDIANDGLEMCTDAGVACKNIAKDLYSSSPLSSTAKNITNQCKAGIDSAKKFASSLNPANGLTALANLVKFLLCPEAFLLNDLTNTFNNVVRGSGNIKPASLLNNALQNLTKSLIKGGPPTLNNTLNFFTLLGQYFKTNEGSRNKQATFESIASLLNNHGRDMSYLVNANMFSGITDMLDPNNAVYKNMNVHTPLPVATVKQYCSNLAKIIAQMQAQYRSDNIYDDLVTDRSITANIRNASVASEIDSLTGMTQGSNEYINSINSAQNIGYHGETALNSSLVASVENAKYFELMQKEFTEAGDDPVKLEIARINAIEYNKYLTEMNNTTSTKLVAFNKGIDNIKRESDYYDVSGIIRKTA
jgi:hypothetical protein